LKGENISISAKLNGADSCPQADNFYFTLNKRNRCRVRVILPIKISLSNEKISELWIIPKLPSQCFGKVVKVENFSLWKGNPKERGIKISQFQDPKVSGNITFCAPQKIARAENASCPIEYGKLICFYERLVLPFYNPKNITLEHIQIVREIKDKESISELSVPLKPNETKVLILEDLKCPLKEKQENFTLRWICKDKFYETKLGVEAGKTVVVELGNVTSSISQGSYSLHPTLEDCEKLTSSAKNFCYDDVAEISGNEKICEKISDDDIKKHCIARTTLNSSLCEQIKDDGLRKGCVESVKMKKKWLRE
jgi:hypothetical protein